MLLWWDALHAFAVSPTRRLSQRTPATGRVFRGRYSSHLGDKSKSWSKSQSLFSSRSHGVVTSRSICLGHLILCRTFLVLVLGPWSLVIVVVVIDGAVWMTKAVRCPYPVKLPCQSGCAVQWRRGNCLE